jgi:hypothetical protein
LVLVMIQREAANADPPMSMIAAVAARIKSFAPHR